MIVRRGGLTLRLLDFALVRAGTLAIEEVDRLACPRAAELARASSDADRALRAGGARVSDALYADVARAPQGPARSALLAARRAAFRGEGVAPAALSGVGPEASEALVDYSRRRARVEEIAASGRTTFADERRLARARLLELCSTPRAREALLLDSEALWQAAARLGRSAADAKALRRFELSAAGFLSRWACRPTPLSVLTAVSVAEVSQDVEGVRAVRAGEREISRRRVGLGAHVVRMLAQSASDAGDGWRRVRPRVTPTLARREGQLEFWRPSDAPGQQELCALDASPAIDAFLKLARGRRLDAAGLIAGAAAALGLTEDDAQDIYRSLVRAGLLLGSLEIPVEEPDPLGFIERWLETSPRPDGERLSRLRRARSELAALSEPLRDGSEARDAYERVRDALAADVPSLVSRAPEEYIALDSASSWSVELGAGVVEQLGEAVAVLERLQDVRDPFDIGASLRRAFPGREEVPLLSLWDADFVRETPRGSWRPGARERLNAWLARQAAESPLAVELRLETAEHLAAPEGPSPARAGDAHLRFSVFNRAGQPPTIALDEVFGSATNAYARWLALLAGENSPERHPVFGAIREALAEDERRHPSARSADVVYHAGTAGDQVAWHPRFRALSLEANHLSRTSADGDEVVPLGEVFIVLTSTRPLIEWRAPGSPPVPLALRYDSLLALRAHPWIPAAVSATLATLPSSLRDFFDPLARSDGARWLPAFVCGHVVLQPRCWWLDRTLFPPMGLKDEWDRFRAAARWAFERELPRRVWAWTRAGESPRLVDFESPALVDALLAEMQDDACSELALREEPFLFGAVRGEADRFARQFSIGFSWERRDPAP